MGLGLLTRITNVVNVIIDNVVHTIVDSGNIEVDDGEILIKGLMDNSEEATPLIDMSTHAFGTIDYAHHKVHAASMFTAFVDSGGATFDTGDELFIAFTAPAGAQELHVLVSAYAAGAALLEILEGPTITVDLGANRLAYNHNRAVGTASTIESIETAPAAGEYTYVEDAGAAITAPGTVLESHLFGASGPGNQAEGAGANRGHEWILDPGTTYAFRITAMSDNLNAHIDVTYYQHTPEV